MDYDISTALQRIEDELLASMIRNLNKHIKDEQDEQVNYTMWQVEQLKALEEFKARNTKHYMWKMNGLPKQVKEILEQAYKTGQFEQEKKILDAIEHGYKPRKERNVENNEVKAEFFKVHDEKVNALINETVNNVQKAGFSILRTSEDMYRKAIFTAQVYLATGAGTLQQAVQMATKDYIKNGIQSVEYANGRRVNAQSYSEMALRTANKRAYLQGESVKRDEWGINTVIVTRRGVACPKCIPHVGKVYIDDVYSSYKPTGQQKYPLLSSAIAQGLYHPNCKDSHSTYFEGMDDDLKKPLTESEIKRAKRVYKLEQAQRYNERNIRKYKRLSRLSVDDDEKERYNNLASEWMDKQNDFITQNSGVLKRRRERERVYL